MGAERGVSQIPALPLLFPPHRDIPERFHQPKPLRLPPVQDCVHDVGRRHARRGPWYDGQLQSSAPLTSQDWSFWLIGGFLFLGRNI
jgi:hypothetical protein